MKIIVLLLIVFFVVSKETFTILYMGDGRPKNLEVHLMIQDLLKEQVLLPYPGKGVKSTQYKKLAPNALQITE